MKKRFTVAVWWSYRMAWAGLFVLASCASSTAASGNSVAAGSHCSLASVDGAEADAGAAGRGHHQFIMDDNVTLDMQHLFPLLRMPPSEAGAGNVISLDVNRTVTDANGRLLSSIVARGSVQLTPDPATPEHAQADAGPRGGPHHAMQARIMNGTVSFQGDTVTLTQLAPRGWCMWPGAGTVVRTNAAGISHTLVFANPCGSATLDGKAVTLPGPGPRGGHGSHDSHGPRGPHEEHGCEHPDEQPEAH